MKIRMMCLAAVLAAAALYAQELKTDFTDPAEAPLVTHGDYVLRGTVLVQYQGKAEEVVIPANLGITEIADAAFTDGGEGWRGNEYMRSLVVPEGIVKMGAQAFIDCYKLETVRLPASLTAIGDRAFSQCRSLVSVQVDGRSPAYTAVDGALFTKDRTVLLRYPPAKTERAYTVPASVTRFEADAFSGAAKLEEIRFPGGLTLTNTDAYWKWHPFYGLKGLLPETDYVQELLRAPRVDVIFAVAPESAAYALVDGVLFDKSRTALIRYPRGKTDREYHIPPEVKEIRSGAFSGCSNLKSVTLPQGITAIGPYAFSDCYGLTDLTFPPGLLSIGVNAFSNCSGLKSLTFPPGLLTIEANAFSACYGLVSVTLPPGLLSIGDNAFRNTRLAGAAIPASVTAIGVTAFSNGSLTALTVDARNPAFSAVDGVLFDKSGTTLVLYPQAKPGREYRIPPGVRNIGDSAFFGCKNLPALSFSPGLLNIGNRAFYDCDGLTALTLPPGLLSIGNNAFSDCDGLIALTLPPGLVNIGPSAFSSCAKLAAVAFPESLVSIGPSAFASCYQLSAVTLPKGLKSIGSRAFFSYTATLKTVKMSRNTTLDKDAFPSTVTFEYYEP